MVMQNKSYVPPPFNDARTEAIFPYIDKRLPVSGFFEKLTTTGKEQRKVALLHECRVQTPDGGINLGHFWIQHADLFEDMQVNRPVTFTAIVTLRLVYSEKLGAKARRCNLSVPMDLKYSDRGATCLQIPNKVPVLPPFAPLQPPLPVAADEIPPEEDELEEEPVQLPVAKVGLSPLQAIRKVRELADQLGGLDVLIEIVEELKKG